MIRRRGIVILTLALTLAAGIAFASEDVHGGAAAAHKIILMDSELISPSALTMSQADKIRCRLIGAEVGDPNRACWPRFGWRLGRQLTATIPPGRFASMCSLAPGQYAYVASQVSGDFPRPGRCARHEGHHHGAVGQAMRGAT